ncbi:hypothetical protein [Kiloniella antarctica]|uniref:Uncharacterized protein n=1 Tax=Kiloniella antarctica TaxID=1550907 RepID=A0ABW5BSV7_9PROT
MPRGIDFKGALKRIEFFEKSVDVTKIKYEGVTIWPLMRSHVVRFWLAGGHQNSVQGEKTKQQPKRKLSNTLRLWIKMKERAKHLVARCHLIYSGRNKIWFIPGPLGHAEFSQQGYYDKFVDAVSFVTKREDFFKLLLHGDERRHHYAMPAYNYSLRHLIYRASCDMSKIPFKLNDFEDGYKVEALLPYGKEDVIKALSTDLIHLMTFANDFTIVLRKAKPKAIFIVCYESIISMAMILAARRVGVPVIDVQHGKQGKYNVNYTHFTHLPKNGWDLLPNYFWCWGEQSAKNISRHMPASRTTHFPYVIGYLWVALWKNGEPIKITEKHQVFIEELKVIQKKILVTLQPLSDPLPEILLRTMENSPPDWLWLIRMHPNMLLDCNQVINRLDEVAKGKFEVTISSEIPLYPLLKAVDHHVTAWSSVAYEALEFGVSTTIIDETGLDLYSNEIENQLFLYADTKQQLLNTIEQLTIKKSIISNGYIKSNLSEVTSSLERFITKILDK